MIVVHVISGLGMGGAETMLVQLATRLQGHGFQQHIVSLTRRDFSVSELERLGIPVTCAPLSVSPRGISAFCDVVALVRRLRPHILQGWMYHGDLVAALAHRIAPYRRERRLFWGIRASNMDGARYRNVVKWAGRISGWPDAVIANSEAGLRFHIASGYRPRHTEVIPNGVDIEKFRQNLELRKKLRAELAINANSFVAIHVARVDAMKDHSTCVAALAALPNVIGLLVGRGTDTLTLPGNVRGLGERTDVAALYAASDVVLSSSAFGEGFSNAIAEGMCAGLVPIATDVGDARSIIGATGTVIPPGAVPALVEAIRIEAGRSADERGKKAIEARNRIIQRYSLDRMAERYIRLYEKS